jgi:hypothetical protein
VEDFMLRFVLVSVASMVVSAALTAQSTGTQDPCQSNCPKVTAAVTVGTSVTVDAVLIPPKIAAHIFGTEISKNYAVVRMTVANHSPDESLVIHSVYLDTSAWMFGSASANKSGQTSNPPAPGQPSTGQPAPGQPVTNGSGAGAQSTRDNCDDSTQSQNSGSCPSHVSSVNGAMLRDEVLFQQPFTKRNLIVGLISDIGTVATAFSPVFTPIVSQGFNGWNGGLVPALNKRWPDLTLSAVNNLASHAYENNKIITKQSSETVVAFFPLQYFLTSSFKKMYLDDPAVFFRPQEALADPKYRKSILKLIDATGRDKTGAPKNSDIQALDAVNNQCSDQEDVCKTLLALIQGLNLSNLRVVIGGDMTVNTQDVPPIVSLVTFKKADGTSYPAGDFSWLALGSTVKGVIAGKYLKGGTASVTDSSGKALTGVFALTNQTATTDTELDFDLKVAACPADQLAIAPKTNVFFIVSKAGATAAGGSASGATQPLPSLPMSYGQIPDDVSTCAKAAAPAPKDGSADSTTGGKTTPEPASPAASGTSGATTAPKPSPNQ